jgi:hypothetical protein
MQRTAAVVASVLSVIGGFVMLTQDAAVPAARAQSSPSDIFVNEQKQTKSVFESLRGFTGLGGTVGLMRVGGGDLAKGVELRPVMQAVFRYQFNDTWLGLGQFGFGWNSFAARGDTVFAMNFGTLGLARRIATYKDMTLRFGGGAGFYRWDYKFNGKSIRDPETQRFYRGFVPGGYLGFEGEFRLAGHVTLTGALEDHLIFTSADRFHSLFNEDHTVINFRTGVHYYFSPYEGILWERKKQTKIRLESGKAGK